MTNDKYKAIFVPAEMHQIIKTAAARNGMTMIELIGNLILNTAKVEEDASTKNI